MKHVTLITSQTKFKQMHQTNDIHYKNREFSVVMSLDGKKNHVETWSFNDCYVLFQTDFIFDNSQ